MLARYSEKWHAGVSEEAASYQNFFPTTMESNLPALIEQETSWYDAGSHA